MNKNTEKFFKWLCPNDEDYQYLIKYMASKIQQTNGEKKNAR